MSLFMPDYFFRRIWDISSDDIKTIGAKLLILDVDNTLAKHNEAIPHKQAKKWVELVQATSTKLVILSNNHDGRVEKFAKKLGLSHVGNARKPLGIGFRRVMREFGALKPEMAIIGDQIYTDVLGGNLFGITTVLVLPIEPEHTRFFRFKRAMEKPFLKASEKNKANLNS